MTSGAYVLAELQAKGILDAAQYQRLLPIVRRTVTRLTMEGADPGFAELGVWAWLGVLEAAERDDGDLSDDELESYAVFRARSALLDALASNDPSKHLARDLSARVVCAIRVLRARTDQEPTSRAIAAELGMCDDTYALALDELAEQGHSRIEVVTAGPAMVSSAGRAVHKPDVRSAMADGIARLPEIQRAIFELHYGESLPIEDAAERIGISVGEARRLHTEAIHRMRAFLG